MNAVKISLSVQRNLGNYETASMIVSYEVNPGEDIKECFKRAKKEINEAFIECFVKSLSNK